MSTIFQNIQVQSPIREVVLRSVRGVGEAFVLGCELYIYMSSIR